MQQVSTNFVKALSNTVSSNKDAVKADKSSTAAPGSTYVSKDYYDYNEYSHYDIENEMVKYRLPQPSALPKNEYTYSQLHREKKNK